MISESWESGLQKMPCVRRVVILKPNMSLGNYILMVGVSRKAIQKLLNGIKKRLKKVYLRHNIVLGDYMRTVGV